MSEMQKMLDRIATLEANVDRLEGFILRGLTAWNEPDPARASVLNEENLAKEILDQGDLAEAVRDILEIDTAILAAYPHIAVQGG